MRKQKVQEKAQEIVKQGQKPSARLLAKELEFAEPDIHRLLNALEKDGEVETYTKEVFGQKHRLVGVKRS